MPANTTKPTGWRDILAGLDHALPILPAHHPDASPFPEPIRMSESLRVCWPGAESALLRFGFDGPMPGVCDIPCTRLAGPTDAEAWEVSTAPKRTSEPSVSVARTADFAAVQVHVSERELGIADATETAYRHLLGAVRNSAQPHLLRIWNYFARINDGDADEERYRLFCVGRARAVDAVFNRPPPAATAIGTDGEPGMLHVIALCTRGTGIALENPRQTPAWQYPREFGPVSPGFSRGALIGDGEGLRLLVSGTASIVGHVSRHLHDLPGQIDETFANLAALFDEAKARSNRAFALKGCESLRVYLRKAEDLALAQTALRQHVGDLSKVLFLRGDVCRRELDIEIEGVFAPS